MFNSKGFTLIEFSVVVAIAIIIGGIFFGTFKFLQPSLQLGSVVRDLITDLRYTQQLAVTEQINHGVRFSTSTGTYQVLRYGTTTDEISAKSLPSAVDFHQISGFTNNEVIFNPYGAVTATGTVSLINTSAETKTIEVRPSGFVRKTD